jgi:hypothetical protein
MIVSDDEIERTGDNSGLMNDTQHPTPPKKRKLTKAQEESKLNGFDRTPGWHKKKNMNHMVNLNNWVIFLRF